MLYFEPPTQRHFSADIEHSKGLGKHFVESFSVILY